MNLEDVSAQIRRIVQPQSGHVSRSVDHCLAWQINTTGRIRRRLVGLKMPRALKALQLTLSRIEQGEVTAFVAIESRLGEEYTTRESRRIMMALQTARLPTVKTLSGYDFSFQPSLGRDRVSALVDSEFVGRGISAFICSGRPVRANPIWRSLSAWR